jgi:hypothetical protein
MKKMRLALTAVIVLGAVSGALAFKKYSTVFCVRSLDTTETDCTGTVTGQLGSGTATHFGYQRVSNCNDACTDQIQIIGE